MMVKKCRGFSLLPMMLSFFLVLFVSSSIFLSTYTQTIIKKESLKSAESDMKNLTEFAQSSIESKIKNLESFSNIFQSITMFLPNNNFGNALTHKLLLIVMKEHNHIRSLILTAHTGETLWISREFEKKLLTDSKKIIPEKTGFTVRHIDFDKKKEVVYYLDVEANILLKEEAPKDFVVFDGRTRPWYALGQEKQRMCWSSPYCFSTNKNGISLAMPFFKTENDLIQNNLWGILCMDVDPEFFIDFKNNLLTPDSTVLLMEDNGILIDQSKNTCLSTELDNKLSIFEINNTEVVEAFKKFKHSQQKIGKIFSKNQYYLYSFDHLGDQKNFEKPWLSCLIIPETFWNSFVNQAHKFNILFMIILLIFILSIVIIVVRKISQPIQLISEDMNTIPTLDISPPLLISSSIKEVNTIVESLNSMKIGIEAFSKYVPKNLVKTLLLSHNPVILEGYKKEISILFTDIENFTGISERMAPPHLLAHLSEYFDHFVNIIQEEQGTIDQFIGDSVMAFWGAPLIDDQHAIHACYATLRLKKKNDDININWLSRDKPQFKTRFGLHTGDMIVGNIGTHDRLSYTAIGDPVNLASRLEGANKIYKSTILLSASMFDNVKYEFACRIVDRLHVKGKTEGVLVYELIGPLQDYKDLVRVSHDDLEWIDLSGKAFHLYESKEWKKSQKVYKSLLKIKKDDPLADIMIQKCQYLINNPPGEFWTPG